MAVRLQKILAEGGFGSRRECEQLILDGRVEIDRQIVTTLGTKVDPDTQSIRVDGQRLNLSPRKYFAVNKPRGVVSTSRDPDGRMRVIDLIPTDRRVYTVGRLDKESEGLIIVTNDGELANRLTHPSFGVEKTYLIQVAGHPEREQMDELVKGIHLAEGFVHIKSYRFRRKQKNTTDIEIVLDEGRNREIRRLLARIGHKVLMLKRIGIGSFFLEDIPPGGYRQLSSEEIRMLMVNPARKKQAPVRKSRAPSRKPESRKTTGKKAGKKTGKTPGKKPGKKAPKPKASGKSSSASQSKKKNVRRKSSAAESRKPAKRKKSVKGRGGSTGSGKKKSQSTHSHSAKSRKRKKRRP